MAKVKQLNVKSHRERFGDFHRDNPHVYRLFEDQIRRAKRRHPGQKIPHKAVLEWLRWEMRFVTSDADFKINNNYFSYYVRLYITINPKDRGLFNLRKLRSEEKGPYVVVGENNQIKFLQ